MNTKIATDPRLETSQIVDLHDLKLAFHSPNILLRERFHQVYGHLPQGSGSKPDIQISWLLVEANQAPLPPAHLELISENQLVSYYGDRDQVAIRLPKYGLITVDLTQSQLTGIVTHNCLDVYGVFEDVMMISLAPLYRRRGWFPLHAFAALAPNGRAALISGHMGSGKTTTGLALLSAGWKLLSNDSPLLRLRGGLVEVLAYPGLLSAFDDSLARFRHLQRFIPDKMADKCDAGEKRTFRAEDAFANPWVREGPVGGVFFPKVVPGLAHSELIKVTAKEALLKLLPQGIEGWDKAAIGQGLQVLSKLVEQAPCYTLRLSPQVEQLPQLMWGGMQP